MESSHDGSAMTDEELRQLIAANAPAIAGLRTEISEGFAQSRQALAEESRQSQERLEDESRQLRQRLEGEISNVVGMIEDLSSSVAETHQRHEQEMADIRATLKEAADIAISNARAIESITPPQRQQP